MSIDFLAKALASVYDKDLVLDAVDEQSANALLAQADMWEIAGSDPGMGASSETKAIGLYMKMAAASLRAAANARREGIERRAAKGDR